MNPKMEGTDLDAFDVRNPDDIAQQEQSEREADAAINRWIDAHRDELKRTILTYADGEAEEQWWALRELFWGSDPIGSDSLHRKKR